LNNKIDKKMRPEIGVAPQQFAEVAHALTNILADEFLLYTKTLKAHWNIEGPDFHSKHLFFEKQYNELFAIIDETAERIRTLGHYAAATLGEFLALSHLTENVRNNNDSAGFIEVLLADHESIIIRLREHINQFSDDLKDMGTSDFITGLMEKHEKMAWMLRAHLR
jgi:starvation-inducible DNA-binding protein